MSDGKLANGNDAETWNSSTAVENGNVTYQTLGKKMVSIRSLNRKTESAITSNKIKFINEV